jgi:hypothetical protein
LGVGFFDEKLLRLCLSWLGDAVFSIRDAATTNIKKLVEIFGYDWAKNTVLPQVMQMAQNENYLYRMTTLFTLSVSILLVLGNSSLIKPLLFTRQWQFHLHLISLKTKYFLL